MTHRGHRAFTKLKSLTVWCSVLLVVSSGFMHAQETTQQEETEFVEGPKLKWNISLWGGPRPGTKIADSISEKLDFYTNGNWEFKLHYGEGLSKPRENLDGIAIKAFEAAMICNIYHPQKNPALMVMSLPFLPLGDWEDRIAVREVLYDTEPVKKEFKRWGAMIYTSSFLPRYEVMGRGEAPFSLDDWKGKIVRAAGGFGDVLKKLGATPSGMAAPEVYTGIQTGSIDAVAFPFTYSHVSYRIHEVSSWFTTNLSLGTADCPIVFSIEAYNKLPQQYRDLLARIKPDVIEEQRQAYVTADTENLPMLRDKLTEITYSEEDLEKFRARFGRVVIEEWIEENSDDFDARELVELVFKAVGKEYK